MFGLDKERIVVQEAVLITNTLAAATLDSAVCHLTGSRFSPGFPSTSPQSYLKPFSPYDGYVLKTTKITAFSVFDTDFDTSTKCCGSQKLQKPATNIRLPQVQYNSDSTKFLQTRSHSVDQSRGKTPPYTPPSLTRTRQRSVSSHASGCGRRSVIKRSDNEDALKRSRLHSNAYELSQDLLDKQVEMLERKYGGAQSARHAALTIQRAFRKYCMVKKFLDITKSTCSKSEKRLSRRFNTLDFSNLEAIFNEQVMIDHNRRSMPTSVSTNGVLDNNVVKTNFATLYGELNSSLKENGLRPTRSMSMRESRPLTRESSERTHNTLYGSHLDMPMMEQNGTMICPTTGNEYLNGQQEWPASQSVDKFYAPSAQQRQSPAFSEDSAISSTTASSDGCYVSGDQEAAKLGTKDVVMRRSVSSHMGSNQTVPIRSTSSWHSGQQQDNRKKVPPPLPKRTSSILSTTSQVEVKSKSSSELHNQAFVLPSSVPLNDKNECDSQNVSKVCGVEESPVWKRKAAVVEEHNRLEDKRLSNISETSEDSLDTNLGGYSMSPPATDILHSYAGNSFPHSSLRSAPEATTPATSKLTEVQRKRQYRVGLNLFNKKPEKGITYLVHRGFLENSPQAVARFLLTRKGLSKQNIGDYLGNLQDPFNMAVLDYFAGELDLAGMQVDVALRKFQTHFRLPGEAQKIERLMEVFAQRYCECNQDIIARFQSPDTVFVLAFAIIMLNTDLHTPSLKPERRMKAENFVRNLRGVDDGCDIERDMLLGIYERIKACEFRPGSDHVSQVMKVQQSITGKNPILALPHRRLVCYCRLYEVPDVNKRERPGLHQREVFLFNDLLVVTKIFSKKKNSVTYSFRQSYPLYGLNVSLFASPYYAHGIRLSQRVNDKVLIVFNSRNEHDRTKFVEDLKESIHEMDEMENIRIEGELEKQKLGSRNSNGRGSDNRDSGVADMELAQSAVVASTSSSDMKDASGESSNLKRTALSNSLLDLHEQCLGKPLRRGSAGSLDSGMSISFQSSAASTVSRDSSPHQSQSSKTSTGSTSSTSSNKSTASATPAGQPQQQPGFLGGLFTKKGKYSSKGNVKSASTDV